MRRFPVSPAKEKALRDRMASLGIREEDLLERFVRSRGRGGQNVNKVSTCVHIKHLPTGVEVKCQTGRSQALNRYHARAILTSKLETIVMKEKSAEVRRIEKIRRQKRKRSKRAKEKILADKKIRSETKGLRSSGSIDREDN
jgi:protein subunit release factor B